MNKRRPIVVVTAAAVLLAACSALPDPRADRLAPAGSVDFVPDRRGALRLKRALAVLWDRSRDEDFLARVHPRTLEVGRRVHLGEQGSRVNDLSPDRRHILFSTRDGEFRLFDVDTVRLVREFFTGGGWPVAVNWVAGRRAVAVRANPWLTNVSLLDPVSGEVMGRDVTSGTPVQTRRLSTSIVLLLQQQSVHGDLRPARLAVIDDWGKARIVTIDRVPAGYTVSEGHDWGRSLSPALAVRNGEAIVVGTNDVVARINLDTLDVEYPEPRLSLIDRFAAAFSDTAHAKFQEGFWLRARWVGGDVIAVTGRRMDIEEDADGDTRMKASCPPIRLLDTSSWTFTRFAPGDTALAVVDGALLTFGGCGGKRSHRGVTAWSGSGGVLWRALDNKYINGIRVRGRFAYVTHGYERLLQSVVDVRNGRVLVTRQSFASFLPY